MSARWYYETVSSDGRWTPHLSETRPEIVILGGHTRLQPATGKGIGPRLRALSEVHPELRDKPLAELQALLSPDQTGTAVDQPLQGVTQ